MQEYTQSWFFFGTGFVYYRIVACLLHINVVLNPIIDTSIFLLRLSAMYNRETYTKVAGKYQDVITLEQSVAELHQMFLDFALLTMQQGELIDQIEFNVKGAADYVEEANVDVHQAIEYSKKSRKKQWYVQTVGPFLFLYLHSAGSPHCLLPYY